MTILIDTSFLYALYNTQDSRHPQAMSFSTDYTGDTIIPDVVLPEVGFLFLRDTGYAGLQEFMERFANVRPRLIPVENSDLTRAATIMTQYASAEFDVVDCCIMAIAERLAITQIATFDHRDFRIYRPQHCDYLTLLP